MVVERPGEDPKFERFKHDLNALKPDLLKFALSLSRNVDAAENLVHETLRKAIQNRHQFEEGTNLGAWTTVILRNAFFDEQKKSQRTVGGEAAEAVFAEIGVSGDQESKIDLQDIKKLIAKLPKNQQEILRVIAIEGLKYREAAVALNIAEGRAKSRLWRARFNLNRLQQGLPVKGTFPTRRDYRRTVNRGTSINQQGWDPYNLFRMGPDLFDEYLKTLPTDIRDTLKMIVVDGRTEQAVATEQGLKDEVVKNRVHEARVALHRFLRHKYIAPDKLVEE